MHSQDFLRQRVQTPLLACYTAGGVVCSLATNCACVLESAQNSFLSLDHRPGAVDFSIRIWVDENDSENAPWPMPYVRGLDDLVFAGFSSRSALLADLHTRRVIGRFSATMGSDSAYWRTVIFPILVSIIAGSVGIVELHASCVAKDDYGLLLIGPSRSGKSTLAMALVKAGFRLLSDDRTFCVLKQDKVLAYGLPRPLKLRREAAQWFEELRDREAVDSLGGERVFFWELNPFSPRQNDLACKPQALVFLDRGVRAGFSISRIERRDIRGRIEPDLLVETADATQRQGEILDSLAQLSCWELHFGGRPQDIVEKLVTHLNALKAELSAA